MQKEKVVMRVTRDSVHRKLLCHQLKVGNAVATSPVLVLYNFNINFLFRTHYLLFTFYTYL